MTGSKIPYLATRMQVDESRNTLRTRQHLWELVFMRLQCFHACMNTSQNFSIQKIQIDQRKRLEPLALLASLRLGWFRIATFFIQVTNRYRANTTFAFAILDNSLGFQAYEEQDGGVCPFKLITTDNKKFLLSHGAVFNNYDAENFRALWRFRRSEFFD